MDSLARPALYSFIGYRKESSGGILFNPYLMSELALDDFECAVVELCGCGIPVGLFPVELARRFLTDRASAERRLDAALAKLDGYFAICWSRATDSPADSPVARSGPPVPVPSECFDRPAPVCLSAPLSILWEITHACNLGCAHCLSACGRPDPHELSTQEAETLIDELAALRVFWITLGGGEPLVRPDVYELMARATARNLGIRLTTNGYCVDREVLRRLEDVNVFSAQLSLDGLESTHDLLRQQPGAFRHATEAIRLFVAHGYTVLVNYAITGWNWTEVPATAALAADLGVTSMKVGLVVPLGRGAGNRDTLAVSHSQVMQLASEMREAQERLKGRLALQLEGLFPFLLDPEPSPPTRDDGCGPGCSAGVAQVVVSYDGSVYPCPYLRKRSAGNVRTQSLLEIWNDEVFFAPLRHLDRSQLKGKCQDCPYRPHPCPGGCRGAADACFGDLLAEDPHCWRGVEAEPSGHQEAVLDSGLTIQR